MLLITTVRCSSTIAKGGEHEEEEDNDDKQDNTACVDLIVEVTGSCLR